MDYGVSSQQLAVICALSSGATLIAAAEQAGVHRNTINNWRRNCLPFQQALSHAQYDRALMFREKAEALADLAFQAIHQILADPKTPASVRLRAALAIVQIATNPPEPKKQVELDIEKIVFKHGAQTVTGAQFESAPPVHNHAQPQAANPAPPVHRNAQPAAHPAADPPAQPEAGERRNPPPPEATAPPVHKNAQPAGDTQARRHQNPPSFQSDTLVNSASAWTQEPPPLEMHNSAQAPYRRETPKVGRNDACPCGSGKKHKRCCLDKPLSAAA